MGNRFGVILGSLSMVDNQLKDPMHSLDEQINNRKMWGAKTFGQRRQWPDIILKFAYLPGLLKH